MKKIHVLECEQQQKLISFYERQGFKAPGTVPSDELLQMYKII